MATLFCLSFNMLCIGEGAELEELEAEAERLAAADAAAAAGARGRAETDRAQGIAVMHQRTIWEKVRPSHSFHQD